MRDQSVPFSTEFPISHIGRAEFVAQVVAWLRGTNYSQVLENTIQTELDKENVLIRSRAGEVLRIREISKPGEVDAIGFRYDYPDNLGRIWRTEAVATFADGAKNQNFLRIRTQCVARNPQARLEFPSKPYFIKSLINDGIPKADGVLDISDGTLLLSDDVDGLDIAEAIIRGTASEHLPIVYVSCHANGLHCLSEGTLSRMAFRLGGVAHVILEPSRAFSFNLKERVLGKNPYDGTIGVIVPSVGLVRKFYLGGIFKEQPLLQEAIEEFVISTRSRMPSLGWDWAELQEQSLRIQRQRDKERLSSEETEALYAEEMEALRERIAELEVEKISSSRTTSSISYSSGFQNISSGIPEIYAGEVRDRLNLLIQVAIDNAEAFGLDNRTISIAEELLAQYVPSDALGRLRSELASSTKDAKRVGREVAILLEKHGYDKKSENKHIRMSPKKEFAGLDSITLPKTPSESRGLMNLKSQIEAALGITKLGK